MISKQLPLTTACGRVLNETRGTLTSPGYPSPYPPHQNCQWTIKPHPFHSLRITIETIDIEPSTKCTTNYVKVEHGHFPHQDRLCRYCPEITYIVNETMYVRFRSGDANLNQHTGFRLRYQQVRTNELSTNDTNFVLVDGKQVPYHLRLWI